MKTVPRTAFTRRNVGLSHSLLSSSVSAIILAVAELKPEGLLVGDGFSLMGPGKRAALGALT